MNKAAVGVQINIFVFMLDKIFVSMLDYCDYRFLF